MRKITQMLGRVTNIGDVGAVERIDTRTISGYVRSRKVTSSDLPVELFINDTLVTRTTLNPGINGKLPFEIGVYDVWRFANPSDRITVLFDGTPLRMPNGKDFSHPEREGKEDLDKLLQRYAAGQSFDAKGRITKQAKDQDHTWQDGVMKLYQEVDRVIEEVTGSRSFLFSGTLLGYVRHNGFIPHDKDMDCAYLSSKATAEQVAEEFAQVGHALVKAGYSVTPKASCISVRRTTGSKIMVDIAHLFIKSDGNVGFPFGRVGTDDVDPGVFHPVEAGELNGYRVGIPSQPEAVVEHVYGEEWSTPDPGFKWGERRRSRDPEPLLDYSQRTRIAMDDYYSRPETAEPSAFSQWLAKSGVLPELSAAYDLGCGNGRDLQVLVTVAKSVIGLERSPYAVAAATSHVADQSAIAVHQIDVLQPGAIGSIVTENQTTGSRLFYVRFVLNGLTDAEQGQLLQELQAVLRPGDVLAFEHRTDQDEKLKKARFRSYRRFINTEEFARQLQQIGVEIIHREEGTGLALFERENPHVVRLIAKLPE